MILWLSKNFGTIIISAILILCVCAIVRKMIKDKKNGKSSCGCGCSGCAMSGVCHKDK